MKKVLLIITLSLLTTQILAKKEKALVKYYKNIPDKYCKPTKFGPSQIPFQATGSTIKASMEVFRPTKERAGRVYALKLENGQIYATTRFLDDYIYGRWIQQNIKKPALDWERKNDKKKGRKEEEIEKKEEETLKKYLKILFKIIDVFEKKVKKESKLAKQDEIIWDIEANIDLNKGTVEITKIPQPRFKRKTK